MACWQLNFCSQCSLWEKILLSVSKFWQIVLITFVILHTIHYRFSGCFPVTFVFCKSSCLFDTPARRVFHQRQDEDRVGAAKVTFTEWDHHYSQWTYVTELISYYPMSPSSTTDPNGDIWKPMSLFSTVDTREELSLSIQHFVREIKDMPRILTFASFLSTQSLGCVSQNMETT
jgi:hypothetical protein